jgi:hypothetical protein
MYLAFNINPYQATGNQIVSNYPGGLLMPILYNQASPIASVPSPGDVISFNGTSFITAGHTAIVTATSVDNGGNGSITLLQENSSGGPTATLTVSSGLFLQ